MNNLLNEHILDIFKVSSCFLITKIKANIQNLITIYYNFSSLHIRYKEVLHLQKKLGREEILYMMKKQHYLIGYDLSTLKSQI